MRGHFWFSGTYLENMKKNSGSCLKVTWQIAQSIQAIFTHIGLPGFFFRFNIKSLRPMLGHFAT